MIYYSGISFLRIVSYWFLSHWNVSYKSTVRQVINNVSNDKLRVVYNVEENDVIHSTKWFVDVNKYIFLVK